MRARRHDLTLELVMDGPKDEVSGHLEYRADLFEHATAVRFVRHLEVCCPRISLSPPPSLSDSRL